MFTIVGSGFGMYGYLPAVVRVTREKVILQEKYLAVVTRRPELSHLLDHIEWEPSLERTLLRATGVVIATPPQAQQELAQSAACLGNIKRILLEKPIATDPVTASRLLNQLWGRSKRIRVGYTFVYTDWYPMLRTALLIGAEPLRVHWSFKADHFARSRETWKRYHTTGGGPLRFYGIHLIATLASLGYVNVTRSDLVDGREDQPATWMAEFGGDGVPRCEVIVRSDDEVSSFAISTASAALIYADEGPFRRSTRNQDARVALLERIVGSFEDADEPYMRLYTSTNDLWMAVEDRTEVHA